MSRSTSTRSTCFELPFRAAFSYASPSDLLGHAAPRHVKWYWGRIHKAALGESEPAKPATETYHWA